MVPEIGRLRQIGVGREATPGTAVTPTFWIGVDSGKVIPDIEYVTDETAVGRIESPIQSEPVKENTITTFTTTVRSDWIGLLLTQILGTVNTVTAGGETIVFEHTISVDNTNSHPTLTLSHKDGIATEASTFAMLNSLEFTLDARGLLLISAEVMGRALVADTETPAYVSDALFTGVNASIKFADNLAGLGGASVIGFHQLTLTIEANLEQHHIFGSKTLDENINKQFSVSGELQILHENNDFRDRATDGTDQAIRFFFENPKTIGVGETTTLQIDLAKASFETFDVTDGNNDIIVETLGFTAQYDLDEGSPQMIEALLTNLEDGTNYS